MTDTVRSWIEERRAIHTAADTGRWYAFDTGVGSSAIRSDEAVFEDMYMMKPDKTAVVDAHNMFPRALDALNAVLELHKPFEWSFGYEPIKSCRACVGFGAAQDNAEWPCPTVQAIEGAINNE